MAEHTPHQKKIVERYYENLDEIMLARLGEIVTDLHLAESDRDRTRLWERAGRAMKAMSVPRETAERILTARDPEILARSLREWLAAKRKPARRDGER